MASRWIQCPRSVRAASVASLVLGAVTAVLPGATVGASSTAVPTGKSPVAIALDTSHGWVANSGAASVTEFSLGTGAVLGTLGAGRDPLGVVSTGTAVFVADGVPGSVTVLSAATGKVLRTAPLAFTPVSMTEAAGRVWVASAGGALEALSTTGIPLTHAIIGHPVGALVGTGTTLFASEPTTGLVAELSGITGGLERTVHAGKDPSAMAVTSTTLAAADPATSSVTEVRLSTGATMASVSLGAVPSGLGSSSTALYVAEPAQGRVAEVDLANGRLVQTFAVGASPSAVATTASTAYVVASRANSVSALPVVPLGLPSAPTGVSATPSPSAAAVSFTPPSSTGGAPVLSYTVTAQPSGASCTTTSTSCTVSGLTNGTTYHFTATTTTVVGTSAASAPSVAVYVAGPPSAPTGLVATGGVGLATLNWVAPTSTGGDPVLSYEVTSSIGGFSCTALAPNTTCSVPDLVQGTTYRFTVVATNAIGSGPASNVASITIAAPPTVPSAPTAPSVVGSNGAAIVSWSPPKTNGGAPIQRYTAVAAPGGLSCTVAAPSTTCTISGLTNGTGYLVTVSATNSVGQGPSSQATTWGQSEVDTSTNGQYYALSCSSPGTCLAVGEDATSPISATEAAGTWSKPAEVSGVVGGFSGVSCPTATQCVAVGEETVADATQALIDTESNGTWAPPVVVEGGSGVNLTSISCSSQGTCTAVGEDESANQGVVVSETSGTWGAVVPLGPISDSGVGGAQWNAVSCSSASACTAVGQDNSSSSPMVITETAGTWGTAVDLSGSGDLGVLYGVDCTGDGSCTAVGEDSSQDAPIAAVETAGSWSSVTTIGQAGVGFLRAVSCTDATDCVAVGTGSTAALVEGEVAGAWTTTTTGLSLDVVLDGVADDANGTTVVGGLENNQGSEPLVDGGALVPSAS